MVQPIRLTSTTVVLSILVFSSLIAGLGFSMGTQLVNAVLDGEGYSASIVGIHTGLASLATAIAAPFVPWISRRFGYVWPVIVASLSMAALYIVTASIPTLWGLFIARFMFGLLLSVPWVLLEAWVNQASPPKHRGKVASAYGAFLMLGYGLGPYLLTLVGTEGPLPFWVLAGVITAATIPLFFLLSHDPIEQIPESKDTALALFKEAPFLFGSCFVGGFLMVAYFGLIGIYARDLGYDFEKGIFLLTILIIGGLIVQIPIGWLADKIGARKVIYMALTLAFFISFGIPYFDYYSAQVLIVIVYASLLQSLFSLPLALLGQRFEGAKVTAANALFVLVFEAGSVSGPTVLGFAMTNIHPNALPFGAASIIAALLIFQAYRLAFWQESS